MKDGAGIDGARPVRVRMAPSPTGSIHIGNLRTAVFNWLFTRSRGGSFIVRIEDTDRARSAQAYEDEILAELRWLGLEWDEGPDVGGPHAPYRQSERISLYQAHLRDLQEAGAVYSCYCTEDELKDEREAARRRGEAPRYSGRCRELSAAEGARLAAQGRQPSLRFRVPPTGFELDDLIHGHVGFAPEEMGDFIVARPDGIPIYNFAVTVDDHLMGITHVIRGEEHLSNTPRQLALYKAFNWVPPHFAHVPVVLAADRKKLSKRLHREAGLDVLHREGYLPEALLNYVALLGWSPGDGREIMSPDELIRLFSLERVSRGPAVFDLDKLNWMNERYLRSYPVEHLKELLEPYLGANQRVLGGEEHSPLPEVVIELMRERASTLSGLAAECRSFLEPPASLGPEEAGVLAEDTASGVLGMFTEVLEAAPAGAVDWTALLDALRARSGLGMRKVYMPIRVAVTARRHGPELPVMLGILGRAEVLARVQRSLAAPVKAVD